MDISWLWISLLVLVIKDTSAAEEVLTSETRDMLRQLALATARLNGRALARVETANRNHQDNQDNQSPRVLDTDEVNGLLSALGTATAQLNNRETKAARKPFDRKQQIDGAPRALYGAEMDNLLSSLGLATAKLNARATGASLKTRDLDETDVNSLLSSLSTATSQLNSRSPHSEKQRGLDVDEMNDLLGALSSATNQLNSRVAQAHPQGRALDTDESNSLLSALSGATAKLNSRRGLEHPAGRVLDDEEMNGLLSSLSQATSMLNNRNIHSVDSPKREYRVRSDLDHLLNSLSSATLKLNSRGQSSGTREKAAPTVVDNATMLRTLATETAKLNRQDTKPSPQNDPATPTTLVTHPKKTSEQKPKEDKKKLPAEAKPTQKGSIEETKKALEDVKAIRSLLERERELDRKMRTMYTDLADLFKCKEVGEKCGLLTGRTCCYKAKCDPPARGKCVHDCVLKGQDCSYNFKCCGDTVCTLSGKKNYICM